MLKIKGYNSKVAQFENFMGNSDNSIIVKIAFL